MMVLPLSPAFCLRRAPAVPLWLGALAASSRPLCICSKRPVLRPPLRRSPDVEQPASRFECWKCALRKCQSEIAFTFSCFQSTSYNFAPSQPYRWLLLFSRIQHQLAQLTVLVFAQCSSQTMELCSVSHKKRHTCGMPVEHTAHTVQLYRQAIHSTINRIIYKGLGYLWIFASNKAISDCSHAQFSHRYPYTSSFRGGYAISGEINHSCFLPYWPKRQSDFEFSAATGKLRHVFNG